MNFQKFIYRPPYISQKSELVIFSLILIFWTNTYMSPIRPFHTVLVFVELVYSQVGVCLLLCVCVCVCACARACVIRSAYKFDLPLSQIAHSQRSVGCFMPINWNAGKSSKNTFCLLARNMPVNIKFKFTLAVLVPLRKRVSEQDAAWPCKEPRVCEAQ